jgi:hypothetical protein
VEQAGGIAPPPRPTTRSCADGVSAAILGAMVRIRYLTDDLAGAQDIWSLQGNLDQDLDTTDVAVRLPGWPTFAGSPPLRPAP